MGAQYNDQYNFKHSVRIVQPQTVDLNVFYRWLVCYSDWSGIIAGFSASVSLATVHRFAKEYEGTGVLSGVHIYDVAHSIEINREVV